MNQEPLILGKRPSPIRNLPEVDAVELYVDQNGSIIFRDENGVALNLTRRYAEGLPLVVSNPSISGSITSYDCLSAHNGPNGTTLRVVAPTSPADVPHRFIFVLPVKADLDFQFGDGLAELVSAGAHNTHNAHLIAPSFSEEPFLGNNSLIRHFRYEQYMLDLTAWARDIYGEGDAILFSFSKGGYSALDLIFRNPDTFQKAVAWDAPVSSNWATLASWDAAYGFGSESNWNAYYNIGTLLSSWAAPFTTTERIWMSGDTAAFHAEMATLHSAMDSAGILHEWVTGESRAHTWASGWVTAALAWCL